jgi:hypothetical protein
MPTDNTSPNMTIVVPIPSVQTGPQWATDLYNALYTTIDQHNHQSGKGVPINSAAIVINADLSWAGFNITTLRTARFQLQASNPSLGTDIGCLYEGPTGDLWYNDSSGAQIQLTASHAIKSASALTGPVTGTTRNISTTYTIDSITPDYELYASTSGGAFSVTLPAPTAGRQLLLHDGGYSFGTSALTLVQHASEKISGVAASKVLSATGATYLISSNGTDWWVEGS